MKIEKINIEDVKVYENNAKLHPAEQIEQIKKSIQEFGNNDPIAVDENNVIIEGHGRLIALKELGYKEIEVIRLSHLNEEQKKAYMLVHNKLTMNSDFDLDLLQEELSNIVNFDMSDYGFSLMIENIDSYEEGEEKIAKELDEANNYVVLEFNNNTDWEKANEILGLERVETCDLNKRVRRHGIGRVIDGKEIIDRLENKNEN